VKHHILIRAVPPVNESGSGTSTLEIRCSCGVFMLDREGGPAEASLAEITGLVENHYMTLMAQSRMNGGRKNLD
jgi:hypothetical protein